MKVTRRAMIGGHLTMIDAPEEANRAVREFLARVENA